MNKVIEILINRDGLTESEAKKLIDETREMIITEPEDADQIISEQLGLEPDYLFYILGY